MARKTRGSSAKVLSLVLGVAFGIVAIVLTIAAFSSGSFELRSRAAQEEIVFKQWQFDHDAEGWVAINSLVSRVTDGYFEAVAQGKNLVVKSQDDINIPLRLFGVKKLKFQIAVLPPDRGIVWAQQQGNLRPSPPPITQAPYQFPLEIRYRLKGKKKFEKPISLTATADSTFHEYEMTFPQRGAFTLAALQFDFSGLSERFGTVVRLDNIRLVGRKPIVPTPRPTGWWFPTPTGKTVQVTKEGVVVKSNLEGGGGYMLRVSEKEQYRLLPWKEEPQPMGVRPREIDLEAYVGCRVQVYGLLTASSAEEPKEEAPNMNWSGVPQPMITGTIRVMSVRAIGPCPLNVGPTSRTRTFQPTPLPSFGPD